MFTGGMLFFSEEGKARPVLLDRKFFFQLLLLLAQPFILRRNKYIMQNCLSHTSLLADDSSL